MTTSSSLPYKPVFTHSYTTDTPSINLSILLQSSSTCRPPLERPPYHPTAATVIAADSSGKATVTIQCQTFRNSTVNCIQSTKAYTVRYRMNSTRYFSSEAAEEQINTGHNENINGINTPLHGCMMWKLAATSASALMVLFCGTSRILRIKIQCITHEIKNKRFYSQNSHIRDFYSIFHL